MAKFTSIALLLALLLAIAHASTIKTIITTTIQEEEESSQGGGGSSSQRCMQQIRQQQQQLQHCQRYLEQSSIGQLSMVTDEEYKPPHHQQLRECCDGLQSIHDEQCRCQAVRQAVQEAEGQGQRQEMLEKARNLPAKCNLEPQQCQISSLLY